MGLNAQIAVPSFTAGNTLTAEQQNQINTGIPVFATTVTRDAAFGGSGEKTLALGQFCFVESSGLQRYDGTNWLPYGHTTPFTPTWTAATTNPVIGNGGITGGYFRVDNLVNFYMLLTFGTTTTAGLGAWSFTLPVPVTNGATNLGFYAQALDSGVAWYLNGFCEGLTAGSLTKYFVYTSAAAQYSPTVPFTWGNGDVLYVTGTYQIG
jgi:hypothetical protein